jgi:hypothetical protein
VLRNHSTEEGPLDGAFSYFPVAACVGPPGYGKLEDRISPKEIPMKRLASLLMLAFLVSGVAMAGGDMVTLEGTVLCAKCKLHVEGLDECQNVLIVEKGDEKLQYYLTGNDTNEEFGDVCMATPKVRATGTLSEKDGHTWLTATKIEKIEKAKVKG